MNHRMIIDEMSAVQFIPHRVPDGHLDCFQFLHLNIFVCLLYLFVCLFYNLTTVSPPFFPPASPSCPLLNPFRVLPSRFILCVSLNTLHR